MVSGNVPKGGVGLSFLGQGVWYVSAKATQLKIRGGRYGGYCSRLGQRYAKENEVPRWWRP
jgi:hypothetical protein